MKLVHWFDSTTADVRETVEAHAEIVRAAASGDTSRFINAIADHYAPPPPATPYPDDNWTALKPWPTAVWGLRTNSDI